MYLEEKLREVRSNKRCDGVVNPRDSVPRSPKLSSRINITVSVPALNYSFPVNQPENGNSRLIIVLINSKVSVGIGLVVSLFQNLLSQDQQVSAVTFNGEVLDTSKTYKELGITDTSVVSVIISSGVLFFQGS